MRFAPRRLAAKAGASTKAHPVRNTLAAVGTAAALSVTAVTCQGAFVDTSTLPDAAPGTSQRLITTAAYGIIDRGDGVGAMRTNCTGSHYAWADPIVSPGKPGNSHLHAFFGNTAINAFTEKPRETGGGAPENAGIVPKSTCEGGTANLTGYWVPAMLKGDGQVVNFAQVRDAIQIYYKTTHYDGGVANRTKPFPAGLRMIAGNARGTQLDTNKVYWSCQPPIGNGSWRADGSPTHYGRIPTDCPRGYAVQLSVKFPYCWDGRNLDSPDHKSHMAYAQGWPDRGCPPSHPVQLPAITEHIRWPSDGQTSTWYMSSDQMGSDVATRITPGTAAHADWFNGWEPEVMEQIVTNCLVPALDCQMNLIGNGSMLGYDPNAGPRAPGAAAATQGAAPDERRDPPDAQVPGE